MKNGHPFLVIAMIRDCYYHFHEVIWVQNQTQCYDVNVSRILVKFDSKFNPVELSSSLGYSLHEQMYSCPPVMVMICI